MKNTERKKKSYLKKMMMNACIVAFILVLAGGVCLWAVYNSQELNPAKLENQTRSMLIYDNEENLIDDTTVFKHTNLNSVKDETKWAFICTEDKNFYKHNGISYTRILKAAYKNVKQGYAKEGASTISQQLIKNTHLSHEKTFQRKLREAVLAHKLEKKYSKSEILEMYLNVIYFGNGIYGLEGASQYYFGKSASDLTLSESATLAGLIRSPSRYCPVTKSEDSKSRRNLVLSLMHTQGKITNEQYQTAKAEKLITNVRKQKSNSQSYKTAASSQAGNILNLSPSDVAAFGYKIYTYFSPEVQNTIVQTITADDYKIKNVSGVEADKFVAATNPQGHISGCYMTSPTLLNAKRSFASALKPLAVYTPALELGTVTPTTLIVDEAFVSGDFNPKNYDGKYHGKVSVRECVEQSYNVPAVKVLEYTRMDRSTIISKNLGLNLTNKENLSLALGNTNNGTTYNELLAGYCTIANGGLRVKPSFIKRIEDRNGKIVFENVQSRPQVLSEDSCFLMADMMKGCVKNGTAKKLNSLPFDIAAKTGTAERTGEVTNTDAINVSLTSDFVLAVWIGNADMKPEHDLPQGSTGGGICSFIARDIQKEISKNAKKFEPPASVGFDEKSKQYFSKRFQTINETNTEKASVPIIDGKISDTGAPMIWFAVDEASVYEIYKNGILQEVVKNKSGEYIFFDKTAVKDKSFEYYVMTSLKDNLNDKVKTNVIKLYTAAEINKNSAAINKKKKNSGKNWFF